MEERLNSLLVLESDMAVVLHAGVFGLMTVAYAVAWKRLYKNGLLREGWKRLFAWQALLVGFYSIVVMNAIGTARNLVGTFGLEGRASPVEILVGGVSIAVSSEGAVGSVIAELGFAFAMSVLFSMISCLIVCSLVKASIVTLVLSTYVELDGNDGVTRANVIRVVRQGVEVLLVLILAAAGVGFFVDYSNRIGTGFDQMVVLLGGSVALLAAVFWLSDFADWAEVKSSGNS